MMSEKNGKTDFHILYHFIRTFNKQLSEQTTDARLCFVFQEAELRLVKHLPDILTLQRDLVKKFQNVTELTFGTIAEFLRSQKAGTETNCLHQRFSTLAV